MADLAYEIVRFSEIVDPEVRPFEHNSLVKEDKNPKLKPFTDMARVFLKSGICVVREKLWAKELQGVDPVEYMVSMLKTNSREELEKEFIGTPAKDFLSNVSERCLASVRFLLLPTFDYLTLSAKEYRKA